MEWAYAVSGLLVGALVGLTGVGGGALMTPLLVLGFGVAPATAVGTDLVYAAVTKSVGAWAHARRHTVDWRLAGRLALGSVPAALLTLVFLRWRGLDGGLRDSVIHGALGVALILTAGALLLRERLRLFAREHARRDGGQRHGLAFLVGLVLGTFVALTSVGAGALGIVALFFLYPRLAAARIVGTDIAHATALAAVAGLGHASLGTVDLSLLGGLLLGSLPGICLGSYLAGVFPERVLRTVLAGALMLVGARLVF